jgi:hypothetical protein
MTLARLWLAACAALAPAVALAQETTGFSHGWLWALVTIAVVLALLVLAFKRRPPLGRQGPGPAHRP